MTEQHRIVVLGAGYAGLSAAGRAAKVRGARVTVIDARAEFVERVRLHQALVGQPVPRWNLRERLERKGIEFVQARATHIDTRARLVALDGDWEIAYDSLAYALGSIADATTPGVAEYAHSVATPEDTARVPALTGRVAVVGGGSTGIEVATELAETRPDLSVLLITSAEPAAWLSDRAGAHVAAVLDRLGVRVRSGTKVIAVTPTGLDLADGDHVDAETVLWTTGFAVPELAADSGLAVDHRGRVLVDTAMRSQSHPEIYAAGDAAVIPGPGDRDLRMACATALPTGTRAAAAIADALHGKPAHPLRFRYYIQCLSLGRRDGVIQFLRADDTPTGTVLTGRSAAWFKEGVVRGAAWTARP
ncbi:FAD-dependent oxidoreductase [Nocardia uniformis]|uniref:FAD-dependent oxidoreductase n=1 Tax=Nocardia uniformis TaxID=53432 RepID=A0A849CAC9_9NOCA|nr:FAD-dependent oxidoreductase [Nocardia uniformis]NNH75574.1 FAD-dependent oxidoreductase [Nocardia uniformis]